MGDCEKLLDKAKQSQNNYRFADLCRLAECHGFVRTRQKGSHVLYVHPKLKPEEGGLQNFQDDKGKAKPYQVRQLLAAIKNLEDLDDDE